MTDVKSFKMPFSTKHFNENQRVWIAVMTGAQAALCYGKFRGSNRYVHAWVTWNGNGKPLPVIDEFEVDDAFARRVVDA